jgi:ABC-type Fe3+/spermidine/putrescine transport system ATPase subunit
MSFLSVQAVSKQLGESFVVKDVSFTLQQFQKIAIAGETGSGKSTLLKIIAGLVQRDAGEVLFQTQKVRGPEEKLMAGHKGIAYQSQHFELPNHYRVEELLEYANELSAAEAQTLYEVCRIDHLLKRKTDQLSGGEKQRIALARLLTAAPKLLLLDEPYSNLDPIHKNILKQVIRDIGEMLEITCIMVSHDPLDTLSWADEILILHGGKVIQKGTPKEIYLKPVNAYAAALFGTYNFLSPELAQALAPHRYAAYGKAILVRPERFKIVPEGRGALKGKILSLFFLGSAYDVEVALLGEKLIVRTTIADLRKGAAVFVTWLPEGVW